LDMGALRKRYLELQRQVHPDTVQLKSQVGWFLWLIFIRIVYLIWDLTNISKSKSLRINSLHLLIKLTTSSKTHLLGLFIWYVLLSRFLEGNH
jgi:hypothetical protein